MMVHANDINALWGAYQRGQMLDTTPADRREIQALRELAQKQAAELEQLRDKQLGQVATITSLEHQLAIAEADYAELVGVARPASSAIQELENLNVALLKENKQQLAAVALLALTVRWQEGKIALLRRMNADDRETLHRWQELVLDTAWLGGIAVEAASTRIGPRSVGEAVSRLLLARVGERTEVVK